MSSFQAAFGPPRPCAIGTIMMSDSETSLSSTQTLLYSIKAHVRSNNVTSNSECTYYQPEIITLVTPNISNEKCKDLACFCTRVIRIKDTDGDDEDVNGEMMKTDNEEAPRNSIIARTQLLSQTVYYQILYIDPHCLVQKDISHLFHSNNTQQLQSKSTFGLITAPKQVIETQSQNLDHIDDDNHNRDDFDTAVVLIRPCHKIYIDMMEQAKRMSTTAINQNIHTFWNAYFRKTWINLPITDRLEDEYNYSNAASNNTNRNDSVVGDIPKKDKKQHIFILNGRGRKDINSGMEQLYQKWYNKSQLFKENYQEEQKLVRKAKRHSEMQQQKKKLQQEDTRDDQSNTTNPNNSKKKQMEKHKLVTKRYKRLRKEGKTPKEAMSIARSDYGMDKDEERQQSPSLQVANMFGMGGLI